MDYNQLKIIVSKIKEVKIAVIGDFCLDAYWFIDPSKSEISIETGQMTQAVKQQKYALGGAGNIARNLAALGAGDIRAFGVIGPDPFGAEMVRLMKEAGIKTDNLILQEENWSTHVYTKPYIGEVEQNRIDFGNFNGFSDEVADRLIVQLKHSIPEVDVIIINQQVLSGIHTDYFRRELVQVIRLFPDKIFLADSRNYSDSYKGAYRQVNDREAAALCGIFKDPGELVTYAEVKQAAESLFERYGKPLFITRGERGSLISDEQGITDIPGLFILSRIDTVGAGDSYLAGVATTLAAGYGRKEAAEMGTYAAGVTIQKLFQTGTASPDEILEIGKEPDLVYQPDLAEDIRQATYLKDSEIELVREWPDDVRIKYAIFDHDGTVSTLREGWEEIMAPMMMKAILGGGHDGADKELIQNVRTRVHEFIDKTTGIQTLGQMKGLVDLVREFGCVPEGKILDEYGYKEIYNGELLRMVHLREKKLQNGESTLEDFTIKNVVLFLEKLYHKGVKLYLASGTDEEDVKNEARILGYGHVFEGGICGAVGDINKEAKKIVLDRILDSIGESGSAQIVTFGDGPVEIRETRKRGGLTVGVASDEIKRQGLNERKRTRLIKAGADIIIPDFYNLPLLLDLLKMK